MTAKLQKAWQLYTERMTLLKALGSAESLLAWDRETYMPLGATSDRGSVMGTISHHTHNLFTEKAFVTAVRSLNENSDKLSPLQARSTQVMYRELEKSIKLDGKFVEETNLLVNEGQATWLRAKQASDFSLFAPVLTKIVANRREYAKRLHPDQDPYDVLLNDYEEGLTSEMLWPLLMDLKKNLQQLTKEVRHTGKTANNPLNVGAVDKTQLITFLKSLADAIGFDFQRGVIGAVEHPFEISISHRDVRLNTKFDPNDQTFAIMGFIHELGHGLYEQHIDDKYESVFLDHGVSLGIHESQSRFLENIVGRSPEFWTFALPKLQALCSEFKHVTVKEIVKALNRVTPSFIRTESDEVTYNLHIILRAELERGLIHGDLNVKDLPQLWSDQMTDLLGIKPDYDREGVLQDVHWAWGNFGYFPTYTLGNINSAQLLHAFEKDHPNWKKEIAQGNFKSYFTWFHDNIWQHGSYFTPAEVMQNASGEPMTAKYFTEYLKNKYHA